MFKKLRTLKPTMRFIPRVVSDQVLPVKSLKRANAWGFFLKSFFCQWLDNNTQNRLCKSAFVGPQSRRLLLLQSSELHRVSK